MAVWAEAHPVGFKEAGWFNVKESNYEREETSKASSTIT